MVSANDGRWQAGLGDPTLLGWVTVAAYAGTTVLLWMAWRHEARLARTAQSPGGDGSRRRAQFWLGLAMLFILLTLNKQLDLQSWFTQTARDHALANGWYAERRAWQTGFIAALGAVLALGLVVLWMRLRPFDRSRQVALLGLVFLGGFVVARASSFHHVDTLIAGSWLGMRFNGWFEMAGIATVALGAASVRVPSLLRR